MGLYLSVSALYTDEKGEDVNDILFREIGLRGHRRLPRSMAIRKSGKNQVLISTESPDWLLIVYPNGFLDGFGCTSILAELFDCKAFNFELYDNLFWWYNFFVSDELADIFWQHPTFFDGLHSGEKINDKALEARKGNPKFIASQFDGVISDEIMPYYRQLDDSEFADLKLTNYDEYEKKLKETREKFDYKANEGDKYTLISPWVLTDFAAKFGIIYPTQVQSHNDLKFFALKPKD